MCISNPSSIQPPHLPTYSHTKHVNHLFIDCLKHIFVSIHSSHHNYPFPCVISHPYTHANTNHRSFGQIFAHFSRYFMFVHPSNYPPFHLIIIHLSIRPPAHLSIRLSIHSSNFKLVLYIQLTTQIYIRIRKKGDNSTASISIYVQFWGVVFHIQSS